MLPHPLNNFEIKQYCRSVYRFNGVYLRDNSLRRLKDEDYVTNLDEYEEVGTYRIAIYVDNDKNNVTYFDRFGVKNILKEIKQLIR